MKDFRFLFEKYVLRQHRWAVPEPAVTKLMERLRGTLFVDIGANRGFYSRLMEGRFSRIVSFEPNPTPTFTPTYRYALASQESDEQPLYIHTGTGAADTLLSHFKYNPNPRYSGVLNDQHFESRDARIISVKVRRYDTVIQEKADLVKVDVEGAEYEVLQGMTGSLPQQIILEVHNREELPKIQKWFEGHGYRVKLVDSHPHLYARRDA